MRGKRRLRRPAALLSEAVGNVHSVKARRVGAGAMFVLEVGVKWLMHVGKRERVKKFGDPITDCRGRGSVGA